MIKRLSRLFNRKLNNVRARIIYYTKVHNERVRNVALVLALELIVSIIIIIISIQECVEIYGIISSILSNMVAVILVTINISTVERAEIKNRIKDALEYIELNEIKIMDILGRIANGEDTDIQDMMDIAIFRRKMSELINVFSIVSHGGVSSNASLIGYIGKIIEELGYMDTMASQYAARIVLNLMWITDDRTGQGMCYTLVRVINAILGDKKLIKYTGEYRIYMEKEKEYNSSIIDDIIPALNRYIYTDDKSLRYKFKASGEVTNQIANYFRIYGKLIYNGVIVYYGTIKTNYIDYITKDYSIEIIEYGVENIWCSYKYDVANIKCEEMHNIIKRKVKRKANKYKQIDIEIIDCDVLAFQRVSIWSNSKNRKYKIKGLDRLADDYKFIVVSKGGIYSYAFIDELNSKELARAFNESKDRNNNKVKARIIGLDENKIKKYDKYIYRRSITLIYGGIT